MNFPQPSGVPGSPAYPSLNAVAANTTGEPVVYATLRCKAALQVVLAGTVIATGGTISVYGSLDGTNFDTTTPLVTHIIGTDANKALKAVVDKPFIALRADLTGLAGGTAPTVTAFVAAA